MLSLNKNLFRVAGVATLAGLAGFAVSALTSTAASPPSVWNEPGIERAVDSVSALRDSASKAVDPAALRVTPVGDVNDPEFDSSRVVPVAGSPSTFVVPTRDGSHLCVAGPGRLGCATTEQLDGGIGAMSVGNTTDGGWRAIGLMPDGASSVEASYPDGTRVALPIVSNVVDSPLSARPTEVTWLSSGGQTQSLTLPAG